MVTVKKRFFITILAYALKIMHEGNQTQMGKQQVRLLMSVNYHSTSVMVHSPLPSGHIISQGQKCFIKLINIFTKQSLGTNGSPQNVKSHIWKTQLQHRHLHGKSKLIEFSILHVKIKKEQSKKEQHLGASSVYHLLHLRVIRGLIPLTPLLFDLLQADKTLAVY